MVVNGTKTVERKTMPPVIIKDALTEMNISRQRRWQLRQRAAGNCVICGKTAETRGYCAEHAERNRQRCRAAWAAKRRKLRKAAR
jgi:hypothetical protein